MGGYEKYQNLMADWAGEYMGPFIGTKTQREMPEQSKIFLTKLFYGFTEISDAVKSLQLSEVLVSVAPPRSKRIMRDEYLKYQINAYLQEIYILKERLKSYINKLKKVYLKTDQIDRFNEQVSPLFAQMKYFFKDIVNTRCYHVHAYRYNDDDLVRLSSLTFLSTFNDEYIDSTKFEFKYAQRTWKSRTKENNIQTMKLLDVYFERMYEAVTNNGKVVVPSNALH